MNFAEDVKQIATGNVIDSFKNNDLAETKKALETFTLTDDKMLPSVLDAAIDLNNENKLDEAVLILLVKSNKVTITPAHHSTSRKQGVKMLLASSQVNPN